ncbi:MAG TPA: 3-keto-5-aminohexanoate cleavage protein [Thermodesulfovibrionales bacterium]|nr:3-keto-5-aminohexanoate cleavage protein [Thermodesulfovibrionales bacterium]
MGAHIIPLTFAEQPLIVNLAPTGIVPTRDMSSSVPLTPDEIVADVLTAAEKGITIAHIHARDEQGLPSHRKEIFARIIGGIRERRPELVICVSCSGRTVHKIEDRAQVLDLNEDLKPDMASLTLSSLNFATQTSVNSSDEIRILAQRMLERGILPELEIFDLGMINMLRYLIDRRLVNAPMYANLLFGNIATAQPEFLEIGALVGRLPEHLIWSIAGIGAAQLPMAAMAAAAAPGVRIGLEDNLWLDAGRQYPASNLQLVERVHMFANLLHRTIMTPDEFRKRLRLSYR